MRSILSKSCWIALAGLLSASVAWAAGSPIGALTADGEVSITNPSSTFTLKDQEYAYFSGDRVSTTGEATAAVRLSDGLNVTFVGTSAGRITTDGEAYTIALDEGHIVVDAADGVDYQITHDDEIVSSDNPLGAEDGPFVATVADSGDVQFYMPAQLDGGGTGLTGGQIALIVGVLGGAAYFISEDDDDDEPSS